MRFGTLAAASVAFALTASMASGAQLTSITYPEKEKVEIAFAPTGAGPMKGKMKGEVAYEKGQAEIKLSFSKMQPAVLFGGDIAAYVVWAVSKNSAPENLGELIVLKKGASGDQTYTTGKKEFALMVTAEPYYLVSRPFSLVVFTSEPADTKKVTGQPFAFTDFRMGPRSELTSIADLKYTDKAPVALKQAEAVLNLIERLNADEVEPNAVKTATIALGEAKAAYESGKDEAVADAARRSISSGAEALRAWGQAEQDKAAAELAARQAAEKAALEQQAASARQQAASAQAQASRSAQDLNASEAQAAALQKEKDALARDRAAIAAERDALKKRLQDALGSVADTRSTARGTVTSLSGVLFDTGKALLKPDAKQTLAKLAGVMLVFGKTTITIEGYTDDTGTAETNLKLSEARAKTVRDYLETQGITSNRLTYAGKGPADPVAPNDTAEGRAKNRRVEIITSDPEL